MINLFSNILEVFLMKPIKCVDLAKRGDGRHWNVYNHNIAKVVTSMYTLKNIYFHEDITLNYRN